MFSTFKADKVLVSRTLGFNADPVPIDHLSVVSFQTINAFTDVPLSTSIPA